MTSAGAELKYRLASKSIEARYAKTGNAKSISAMGTAGRVSAGRALLTSAVLVFAGLLMAAAWIGSTPANAGPQIAGKGEQCAGIAGIPCKEGLWCDFAPGQCHVADGAGHCVKAPRACTRIFAPVCGCDGKTYGNDCERRMNKVSLDHKGKC